GDDRRIGPNQHPASGHIADKAWFAPAVDQERADSQQTEVAFAISAIRTPGRILRRRINGALDLLFQQGLRSPVRKICQPARPALPGPTKALEYQRRLTGSLPSADLAVCRSTAAGVMISLRGDLSWSGLRSYL